MHVFFMVCTYCLCLTGPRTSLALRTLRSSYIHIKNLFKFLGYDPGLLALQVIAILPSLFCNLLDAESG